MNDTTQVLESGSDDAQAVETAHAVPADTGYASSDAQAAPTARTAPTDLELLIAAIGDVAEMRRQGQADPETEAKRVSGRLKDVQWSALACRALFHTALREGTPHRARFAVQVLEANGHSGTARFLADHALSSGAKPWQKQKLVPLLRTAPGADLSVDSRQHLRLELGSDGSLELPDGTCTSPLHTPLEVWASDFIACLERRPVGIHRDILEIRIEAGARAVSALAQIMPILSVLPVVAILVAESVDIVEEIADIARIHLAAGLRPVILTASSAGDHGLVSAGGGELLHVGPSAELRLSATAEVVGLACAVGVIDLYSSAALSTHRKDIIDSCRIEFRRLLPLDSTMHAFARVLRFHPSASNGSLRAALSGDLLATGFHGEALALLEQTPPSARDTVHSARLLRARFGTARFDAIVADPPVKRSAADTSMITESQAAHALVSELTSAQPTTPELLPRTMGKVLSILHAGVPEQSGGYAVRAHSVLRTLVAHGFEVAAATRPGFPEADNRLDPADRSSFDLDGIRYIRLGTDVPRHAGEYVYMRKSVDRYAELIRREQPAVIHLRSTYVSALPGLIAAKRFGLPVIYEVSGMWELVYEADNSARMEGRRARTVRLENAVLAHADSVVTITAAMRELIAARVSTRRPIRIVPNAVDPEEFGDRPKDRARLAEFGWTPSTPVIGYIGTFVGYEGLDILIGALALLRDRGVDVRALLVGDGAEAARIRSLAAQSGLDESTVVFTGRVSHTEVSALYPLIDICVYPRRSTPATRAVSPLKPFEAMASHKAVIVSDVPALVEIVGDGRRGTVVPSDDASALADAIEAVLADPRQTQDMIAEAAEWTRTERSWQTVGDVFSTEIDRLIGTDTNGSTDSTADGTEAR